MTEGMRQLLLGSLLRKLTVAEQQAFLSAPLRQFFSQSLNGGYCQEFLAINVYYVFSFFLII
jgi:hypothetical protein